MDFEPIFNKVSAILLVLFYLVFISLTYDPIKNYIFYDNVYVTAFLDKDVETDIMPYSIYGNRDIIDMYNQNRRKIHFLPFTPEVLLYKQFKEDRVNILNKIRLEYCNQQVNYQVIEDINLVEYETGMANFSSQEAYNNTLKVRGGVRGKCKNETRRIVEELSSQLNVGESEIYRFVFKYAVERLEGVEINVRSLLSSTMKRMD